MFLSFKQIIHTHEWSEWDKEARHSWKHYEQIARYCNGCGEKEYKLLFLLCPTKKRTGEYCYWCKPYAWEWEKRLESTVFEGVLDGEKNLCYNSDMEKKQQKIFFKENTERNTELYKFVVSGHSYQEAAEKFEISKARAYELFKKFEKKIEKVS